MFVHLQYNYIMKKTVIIQNLKCGGCANTIIKKISALNGVSEVEVDTEKDTVSFIAENHEDVLQVKEKLKVLGYPSVNDANSMVTKAKSFISCANGRVTSKK